VGPFYNCHWGPCEVATPAGTRHPAAGPSINSGRLVAGARRFDLAGAILSTLLLFSNTKKKADLIMPSASRFAVSRRFFLRASILSAVFPQAWAQDPCRGPQPGPDGTFPRSTFGETSTAEEVTEGLDLSGMTAVVTGCNSGLGYETMRVLTMGGAHVIGTARTA
jgi:hypothetical protein